jgi:SpoVK/Ycf46/Vps4 family AAA+-type ATPase
MAAQANYGIDTAAGDPYRGLYISDTEVEQLLKRQPGVPTFTTEVKASEHLLSSQVRDASPLRWLKQMFQLSPFDLDVILIALAPELDLRYERLYAYIQDDVTRKRPTVDLALNLLCPDAAAKLARRSHFTPHSPLIRHGLLHLVSDPNQVQPPLLAHYLKLDEAIIRLLLGHQGLDVRLVKFCQIITPKTGWNDALESVEIKQGLLHLIGQQPLQLYFYGVPGVGKLRTAEALAGEVGAKLLVVDLARLLAADADFEHSLHLAFCEVLFADAILYINKLDALRCSERQLQYEFLLQLLARQEGITILAGEKPLPATTNGGQNIISVYFPQPNFAQRRQCWQVNLARQNLYLDEGDLDTLADGFRLTPQQITAAVTTAQNQLRWRMAQNSHSPSPLSLSDLFAAARSQSGDDLAKLAPKINSKYTWEDIVLPADQLAQLQEICNQAQYRHVVYGEWGFERKLSLGKGLNVLFSGPPGTGKTMAAEVIANALHLDLYKIDLSQVVSKYIGETEKNLDRIFTAAVSTNAILFFDEADALFGKRSEVKDAHDRYANIEVGYLLQKMEEYEGVAILATNLRQHMDEAFVRRIQVIIEFPFPDEEHRRRIWEVMFPSVAPLAEDVNFDLLSRQIRLAGGNIKNIALAAAFYAAVDCRLICMRHILQAARREYQKLGRTWNEAEWS